MNRHLNVFLYDYCPWRYPRNWPKNVRQFFRNIHWAWQRAINGYCDRDTWWLGDYYKEIAHDSLIKLADTCYGYPGRAPWETAEKWDAYLREMAEHFRRANENYTEEIYPNNYYDEMKKYQDGWISIPTEDGMTRVQPNVTNQEQYEKYQKLWLEKEKEIAQTQKSEMEIALKMLNDSCDGLWD